MIVLFDPYMAPELHGSSWMFADGFESSAVYHDGFLRLYVSIDTKDEDEARAAAIPLFAKYFEDREDNGDGTYRHLIPYLYLPDQDVEWIVTYRGAEQ